MAVCLTAVSTASNEFDPELHRVLGGVGDVMGWQSTAQPQSEQCTVEGAGKHDDAN